MDSRNRLSEYLDSCKVNLDTVASDAIERRMVNWCQIGVTLCESPIEQLFLYAWMQLLEINRLRGARFFAAPSMYYIFNNPLFMACRYQFEDALSSNEFSRLCDMELSFEQIDLVYPQQTIGEYRVDFALIRFRHNYDENGKIISKRMTPLIVECDGHDFHEKTKEQAQRDKARDRFLCSRGFKVLRFTGSELWKCPDSCAREVDDLFLKEEDQNSEGMRGFEAEMTQALYPNREELELMKKELSEG